MVTVANEIRNLGDDLSDQKIKFQILGHLLPEFAPLVTTLTNLDGQGRDLDLRSLREAILREENSLQKRQENIPPKTPAAPTLPPVQMAHATQSSSGCSHCGNLRHSGDQGWIKHPELKPDRLTRRHEDPQRRERSNDMSNARSSRDCSRSRQRRPQSRSRQRNRRPRDDRPSGSHERTRPSNRRRRRQSPSPDTDTASDSSDEHSHKRRRRQKDNN